MRRLGIIGLTIWIAMAVIGGDALGQGLISGRARHERVAGGQEFMPMTAILCFSNVEGSTAQGSGFRTWETEPAGWYRLAGPSGRHTALFTNPGHYFRPLVQTNIFVDPGQKAARDIRPGFVYAMFQEKAWDTKRAKGYYQPFVASGTGITQVGFKLAHDGVDGAGPGSQVVMISIHRSPTGRLVSPDQWEQVGPAMPVVDVDCGGPKNYTYSAGWNSGEVATKPGGLYAVRIAPQKADGSFQAYWKDSGENELSCYRVDDDGGRYPGKQLWMAVAGDGDGLLIPYNKRVHRQFNDLTRCISKWSQTYVAQGRGLAGVVCYAAVSGAQPPLSRQRVMVRVREGGPDGQQVGIQKIAIGNGNYTGDASWGSFGAVFAPGEVALIPGKTYAIEMESIENYQTLHGFVNIKGEVSNDKPGFNPYKKHRLDGYDGGTAFINGVTEADFDLDMQITEYEHAPQAPWAMKTRGANLLKNGGMETEAGPGRLDEPADWTRFSIDPATVHRRPWNEPENVSRIAQVAGGKSTGKTVDGGYAQRVDGLKASETYRLSGLIRTTLPTDPDHQVMIGIDPTGQMEDVGASTIQWKTIGEHHGHWIAYTGKPVRPVKESLSVWLRGRGVAIADTEFRADFDDFQLLEVETGVPGPVRPSPRPR